jgi:hypothetical protein
MYAGFACPRTVLAGEASTVGGCVRVVKYGEDGRPTGDGMYLWDVRVIRCTSIYCKPAASFTMSNGEV